MNLDCVASVPIVDLQKQGRIHLVLEFLTHSLIKGDERSESVL